MMSLCSRISCLFRRRTFHQTESPLKAATAVICNSDGFSSKVLHLLLQNQPVPVRPPHLPALPPQRTKHTLLTSEMSPDRTWQTTHTAWNVQRASKASPQIPQSSKPEPVAVGLVSDPVAVGLVSDPVAVGLVSDPVAVGLVSDPRHAKHLLIAFSGAVDGCRQD
ncbi:unnamed protein product [Arctogadus glacialis]